LPWCGDNQTVVCVISTLDIQATVAATAPPATSGLPRAADSGSGRRFHEVLSALNPLQYLPVVGTIYRAVTGDVIPEALRSIGSMIVSGLLGGPIGLVMSAGTTIAEKITGIDPETIATSGLAAVSHPHSAATSVQAVALEAAQPERATPPEPLAAGWTTSQLAAYGVKTDAAGTMTMGDVTGADVLNAIQLDRLGKAAAAYGAMQSLPPVKTARSG
jgi:hypothetical protein